MKRVCDWRERQKHENWTKNVWVSKRRKFAFLNTVLFYLKINLFDFYADDTLTIYTTNIYTTVMDVRFCSDDFFIFCFFFLTRLACSVSFASSHAEQQERRLNTSMCIICRTGSAVGRRVFKHFGVFSLTWFYSAHFSFCFCFILLQSFVNSHGQYSNVN